jgi:hypothetical protein
VHPMELHELETSPKHPGGRPRRATTEKVEEAARLHSESLPWKQIGLRLGLNPETCRRALWVVRKSRKAVGNSPAPVNNPPRGV